MRKLHICSLTSGSFLWILALLAISLVLFGVLSRSSLNRFSDKVDKIHRVPIKAPSKEKGYAYPPILAYWIYGTNGESQRILRLLKAIYHPRNQYLLQLDAASSEYERGELALSVRSEGVFGSFGNVDVVGKSYALNEMGSSVLAATLHAAALLLKISADWDWFITLTPSDYPLLTQDGNFLFIFSFIHFFVQVNKY